MSLGDEAEAISLLPGEEPDGTAATASHWLDVYAELLRFVEAELGTDDTGVDKLIVARRRAAILARLRFWSEERDRLLSRS